MNIPFLVAGLSAAVVALLHVFLGGPAAARPLLETDKLDKIAKFTLYYCWHLVTIAIFAISAAFLVAAFDRAEQKFAVGAMMVSVAFTFWSLVMIIQHKLRFMHFPQWLLFLPVAVFGAFGLVV